MLVGCINYYSGKVSVANPALPGIRQVSFHSCEWSPGVSSSAGKKSPELSGSYKTYWLNLVSVPHLLIRINDGPASPPTMLRWRLTALLNPRDCCNLAMIRVYLSCFRRPFPFVPFSAHSKYLLKIFFNRSYSSLFKIASLKARSCKKMLTLSQNPSTSPGYTTLLSHSIKWECVSHTFVSLPLPPPLLFLLLFLKSRVSSLGWICPWHLCGCCIFLDTLLVSTNSGHMIHPHFVKILNRLFSAQYTFRSQDELKKSWDIWDNGIG